MVAILLADGFEEVEAITPADYLRRAGLDVRLVGLESRQVTGGHGIVVSADTTLRELQEQPEALVLPGGSKGAANLAASSAVLDLIRTTHEEGKMVAAICAAPAVVLHKSGVLQGRRATCFPGLENKMTGATFRKDRVVVDGNIITSRAAGTAAEFSLAIAEHLKGSHAAQALRETTLTRV
jgi:4-methyl-5(b-hydroxyethyl)-thiazole monophosphate biosynthesis